MIDCTQMSQAAISWSPKMSSHSRVISPGVKGEEGEKEVKEVEEADIGGSSDLSRLQAIQECNMGV